MEQFIQIHPSDNVAVAVLPLLKGCELQFGVEQIILEDDIQQGHKFALCDIEQNSYVFKYGFPIGHASSFIRKGAHVHCHNLKTNLKDNLEYSYTPELITLSVDNEQSSVNGYLRYNGEMGIRNELWIIPTVGCVNGQAKAIEERVRKELDLSHVDDVRVYTHSYGCSQLGEDHANTQKALAALAKHPNAGGVLVLGLGCENNQLADMKKTMGEWDDTRLRFLIAQEVEDEIEEGFTLVSELIERMKEDKRTLLPLSKLKVGLKCGGSDGFSGITANPLLGRFSDWLVMQGGTTVLTEVPEMFGAETLLMDRAINHNTFQKTVSLINDFKDYFRKYDQPVYENPSPGNKAGGISTLEEKSLGCTQKGGKAPVVDVLGYTETITHSGLNLLNTPGNDLVAASSLALSGCQLVLFTTGRGTPFGSFVPTMKISTNTTLSEFKSNWIDFNAGSLLSGTTMDQMLCEFTEFITETCNGKKLKHEKLGFKEIAIFKSGITL